LPLEIVTKKRLHGAFHHYTGLNLLKWRNYQCIILWGEVRVMVFNATFNNISGISWWSVLLMEETRVPRENDRPAASH
jgi:hypothetical protein